MDTPPLSSLTELLALRRQARAELETEQARALLAQRAALVRAETRAVAGRPLAVRELEAPGDDLWAAFDLVLA